LRDRLPRWYLPGGESAGNRKKGGEAGYLEGSGAANALCLGINELDAGGHDGDATRLISREHKSVGVSNYRSIGTYESKREHYDYDRKHSKAKNNAQDKKKLQYKARLHEKRRKNQIKIRSFSS
jgi:hypothetical protein